MIKTRFPGIDYLPSRLPKGTISPFRYAGWYSGKTGYDIYYGTKPRAFGISFQVLQGWCGGYGSAMHTFHVNERTVQWSATIEDQQAWICMTTAGKGSFGISAGASVFGDDDLSRPRGLRDAQRLADVVGYAERIG